MKITIFNGSPKGMYSNTDVLAQAFIEGAKQAGAETANVYLINQDIKHCTGCFSCWFRTPGNCIINDDMSELLDIYKNSDIVCFGTPVYLWNMTACLKNFLDRLIPVKSPNVQQNDGSFDMADGHFKMPEVIIISNAGFPGNNNFDTLKKVMEPAQPILEIYRNCGMLLRAGDERIQQIVSEYLSYVTQAGYQIASDGKITGDVANGLNMELMTVPEYVKYISK